MVWGGFSSNTLRLVGVAAFGVNLAYGFALYLLGIESSLVSALLVHGVASSVLDILAAIPFLVFGSSTESKKGFTARSKGTRFKSYISLK